MRETHPWSTTNRLRNYLLTIASLPAQLGQKKNTPSRIFIFVIIYIKIKIKNGSTGIFIPSQQNDLLLILEILQFPADESASLQPRNADFLLGFLGASETWALWLNVQSRSKWYFEPRSAGICRREPRLSTRPYLQRPSTGHRSSYSSPGHGRLRDPQNTRW